MATKKTYTVTRTMLDGTRKYYRGATKREAEEKRDNDKLLEKQGVKIGDNTTFGQLANSWLSIYKRQNLHVRTVETTEGILNRYILPELGNVPLKKIDIDNLDNLMISIKDYSASTQRKVIQLTTKILDRAVAKNIIFKNPIDKDSFKPTAKKPKEIVPLTDKQCQQLFDAVEGTRLYPFVYLLRFTGLRKGEALGLMWKDIDFENGTLHVQRSVIYTIKNKNGEINPDLKTEQADRVIPLSDDVLAMLLKEKQKSNSLYVFSKADGHFLSESSFRSMWAIIERRHLGFEVHPHLLRHTCISSWAENGLDITEAQYLAGHASPEITSRIYTHYRAEQQKAITAQKIRAVKLKCV